MKNQELYEAGIKGGKTGEIRDLVETHKEKACKELERQWRNARTEKSADKVKRKLVAWDSKYKDMKPEDTIKVNINSTPEKLG